MYILSYIDTIHTYIYIFRQRGRIIIIIIVMIIVMSIFTSIVMITFIITQMIIVYERVCVLV